MTSESGNLKCKILNFKFWFYIFHFAFFIGVLPIYAEEPVTLEYHYTPGKALHYRYEVTMSGSQKNSGEEAQKEPPLKEADTFSAKMNSKITMEAKKVDPDGSAWVDVRYDAFDMSQTVNGKEVPLGGEEGKPGESPFKDLIGKTISMHFQKNGKLLEAASAPKGMKNPSLDQLFGQMEGIFPDHPVRLGDSWVKKLNLPIEGVTQKVAADFQNTLESFEKVGKHNCAKIKSVLKFSLPEGKVNPQGAETPLGISVKMEGSGELWQYFDVSEGMVVKTEGATKTASTQSITVPATEDAKARTLSSVSTMDMRFKTELEE